MDGRSARGRGASILAPLYSLAHDKLFNGCRRAEDETDSLHLTKLRDSGEETCHQFSKGEHLPLYFAMHQINRFCQSVGTECVYSPFLGQREWSP